MSIYIFPKCSSTFIKVGEKILRYFETKRIYCFTSKYYLHNASNNRSYNVLFFGTDEFALESLQALDGKYRQKGLLQKLEIVTAYKGEKNAVIKYAKEHNITVHSWPPKIKENEFEIGVVVSFGHLIPSRIIKLFPLGLINVHGSLLPKWRGAAPICHTLMNGDSRTGVSIMKIMPKKFDVGSVIAQDSINIHPDETYLDLYKKLAKLGANLLIETMTRLPDVLNTATPQVDEKATYAPKINVEMSFIKWNEMSAENVYNLQRALTGIHPVRANFNDQVVKLVGIKVVPQTTKIYCSEKKRAGLAIFNKRNKKLYICCKGDSWITVERVLIPGRKPQSAPDFGAGYILNRKEKSCIFY